MGILDLFRTRSQHLYWARVRASNVYDASHEQVAAAAAVDEGAAYISVYMREIYISHSRKLWKKFYPMVHGFIAHAGQEAHTVAGPTQLKNFGEADLERVVVLDERLAGPIPFTGEDFQLTAGLYAVPGQDLAETLLETVSSVGSLVAYASSAGAELANLVKGGIEKMAGLDDARLQLGVQDTLRQTEPFVPGHFIGIAAPRDDIAADEMLVVDGHLMRGSAPDAASAYEDHDYMLLSLEATDRRLDWPRLATIAPLNTRFQDIMRSPVSVADKRELLAEAWPRFQAALHESTQLITSDAERIADEVTEHLRRRLDALDSGGRFEAAGAAGAGVSDPAVFDFADVSPAPEPLALGSMSVNPFA